VLLCNVVNKLHDQDSLTNTCTAEQTDLTTLSIGANQVNNFNTGFKNLCCRFLILITRSRTVDRPCFVCCRNRAIINRLTEQIENLLCTFSGTDYLMGYREDEMRRLPFSEIECITVMDRRVTAIDTEGSHYRLHERLRDLEQILPSYFIRINKSALANEHRIARFEAVFSGGVDAVFQCGYREYVSRRCLSEIRRRYEGI
jgi:hypothetical protein